MKTKTYLWIVSVFTISVFISSCNDEKFLEENPETFYTSTNAFSSSEQVKQVITTLYSSVRRFMCSKSSTTLIYKGNGTDVFDVPQLRISSTFADYSKISADNSTFNTIFTYWYSYIAKVNTTLYAAELENITWSDEEEKQYAIAQAKFFRAYAYRNLGELFGGVPIVDKLDSTARYDYERSTRIETYQFAIDDLESILDYLPETTTEGGRVVKGAAMHYLAELYLAQGTEMDETGGDGSSAYSKAIEYANSVIDGGTYSLMTNRFGTRADETDKNVYWDLFRQGNINYQDGNTECVWAFQIDYDSYLAGDEESYLPYPRNYMPVLRVISGITGTAEDVGGRGVTYVCPTMYTRDSIWEGDFADDMRNEECNIQRTFYYNDPDFPDLYGTVVPYSVLYQSDYYQTLCYPIFWKLSTDKFEGLDQGENRSNLFRDDYAIRLAETILLRAEAYYRSGNPEKAAADINLIRDRAQCAYKVSANDVDIDLILDERARELIQEECRWNTLLRMGGTVAVDRIRKYAYWPTTKATLTFDYNLWPIPQDVIDRNKDNKLEQNPGW